MNSFIKYINEAKITERNDNIKNWKDIVNKFDVIEDAILQPNGKSIRVRGKKDGKFADVYTDYKNSEVAKEVLKKVQAFVGIKESELDEANKKILDAKFQIETNQIFNKENINTMLKIANKIEDKTDKNLLVSYIELIKAFDIKHGDKVKLVLEAAVGQKGRTSYKEAMDYCEENEELVDEFRKIVKKLGGKTVAKALVDKLSQKPEIKDEMDHISNMVVDNTNY